MSAVSATPTRNDDLVSWLIFGTTLALSLGTHAVTVWNLPSELGAKATNKHVEMEFFEPPKPPDPPKVEEPEPPKPPDPPKVKLPPAPVKVAEVKPPPEQAPPPPNAEPPPETPVAPAPIVTGISLDSTTAAGGFAVNTGNTTYGKADTTPTDPSQIKAYRAPKYVPPGGADTQPELIGDGFKPPYPSEAKANDIEGTVVLKVTIDETGAVTDVKLLKGLGFGLDEVSMAAVRKFKFKPATKTGESVGTTITWNFTWYLE